jgi:hypothetical protein
MVRRWTRSCLTAASINALTDAFDRFQNYQTLPTPFAFASGAPLPLYRCGRVKWIHCTNTEYECHREFELIWGCFRVTTPENAHSSGMAGFIAGARGRPCHYPLCWLVARAAYRRGTTGAKAGLALVVLQTQRSTRIAMFPAPHLVSRP